MPVLDPKPEALLPSLYNPDEGRRLALVVGVNNSSLSPYLPPLRHAEGDADAIAQILAKPELGFSPFQNPLIGAAAESAKVKKAISQMILKATDKDFLLFYFSGHGQPMQPENQAEDVYLVTHDFAENEVELDPASHLSLRWLREMFYEKANSSRVLVILDCCYGGNIRKAGRDPLQINLRELIKQCLPANNKQPKDALRLTMTAHGFNEPTMETAGHGFLTGYLLPALHGNVREVLNPQGEISLGRLHDYLQNEMAGHLPNLSGDFSLPCILAKYPEKYQYFRQQERKNEQAESKKEKLEKLLADHSSFVKNRVDSFVGRELELTKIRQRIAEKRSTGGYVTITGQAGQGKSSIIAKLVEDSGLGNVPHHFIPFNPGPDHQVGLLRNLMARLILKYDLSDIYVASESRAALRDFFPRVLEDIRAKGQPETIFVDGLDQLEEEFSGGRDLSFLPTNPPEGIVFVLGTRPDDTLKPLELLKTHAEYKLRELSRADFDLLLAHRKITLTKDQADLFYQKMAGNALYLDLIAKELAEKDAVSPEEIIQKVSENPDNIFWLSTERLKRQKTEWRETIKPLLGVLLVRQEPLSVRHLRQILELESEQVTDGLQRLGGLVAQDGNGRRYLFHLKLQDYLRQDEGKPAKKFIFGKEDEEEYHTRLRKWCEKEGLGVIWEDLPYNQEEQGRREYARQHYVTHLYKAGEWELLWKVLDEGEYGQAKMRHDPSTRSYAQDLSLGRQAAARQAVGLKEKIALLPRLWYYGLLQCSLANRVDNYPDDLFEVMVRVGRGVEALGAVELLSQPNKKARVLGKLARIIETQDGQEAQVLRLRAFEVIEKAPGIEDKFKAFTQLLPLIPFIEAEFLVKARNIINSLIFPSVKARALRAVAKALAEAGKLPLKFWLKPLKLPVPSRIAEREPLP